MQWLILGIGLLLGTVLLVQGFANADPKKLARVLRWSLAGLGVVVVVILVASGRIATVLWILPLLLPFLMRWRALWNRAKAAAGPSPGQTSNVETASLRMSLDHDTGAMDGEVLAGRFAGRRLGDLSMGELMDLAVELRGADPQSESLVEAFLDRSFPDWRAGGGGDDEGSGTQGASGSQGRPAGNGMTVEEALDVLGLAPGAEVEDIKEAHRRLMLKNHPDHGGSTYIAARINQAKDILLARQRARS